jgi:hypothetical protein
MIKLTHLMLENNLREYSDEERKKLGIPSGATSKGGVWYVGDKYAGKVVGGKFVAAAKTQPEKPKAAPASTGGKGPPSDTTKTKTSAPASDPGDRFGKDTNYLQVRDGSTPKERQLVGKVATIFDKAASTPGFYEKHSGQTYPSAEFEKMTGIPAAAAKEFSRIVQDYESPFDYNPDDDSVYIADPIEI